MRSRRFWKRARRTRWRQWSERSSERLLHPGGRMSAGPSVPTSIPRRSDWTCRFEPPYDGARAGRRGGKGRVSRRGGLCSRGTGGGVQSHTAENRSITAHAGEPLRRRDSNPITNERSNGILWEIVPIRSLVRANNVRAEGSKKHTADADRIARCRRHRRPWPRRSSRRRGCARAPSTRDGVATGRSLGSRRRGRSTGEHDRVREGRRRAAASC